MGDKPSAIRSLHYIARSRSFVSLNLRISRTVVVSRCSRNTPTNFRMRLRVGFHYFFGDPPPRYLPPERNKSDRSPSLPHIPVARYCDTGVAVGTRLQAHPSYSAETLPLDRECTTGPGYKNVIVLHAHARLSLRRTRESTRSIGDRNIDERLPSRT